MDSFICGGCSVVFHDIREFLEHKKMCIAIASVDKASETVEMQLPSSVEATVLDADGKSTTFIIINGDVDNKVGYGSELNVVDEAVSADVSELHNPSSTGSRPSIALEIMPCASGICSLQLA